MKVSPRPLPPVISETSLPVSDSPAPPVPSETPPVPVPQVRDSSGFFNGFDLLLAAGVVILAFAAASFAVRNSDFWMHLGTGRLIARGEYEFGRAPFTYVGNDRAYVNHSWLFDFGLYTLYSAGKDNGGAVLIAVKGTAMALLAVILLLMTRAGHALWFGVLGVGLAFLAAAPELVLQPILCSFLFMGGTLFLLARLPYRAGSYRLPIAIAVLFWFWANLDAWFFLGPLTVGLFGLGQWLQQRFANRSEVAESCVPLRTLIVAFIAGCLACMLNPHHLRIWELPPELASATLATQFGNDRELGYLFRSPFGADGLDFTGERGGNPVNAWAMILMMLLGLVGFVVNFRKTSWSLAAVWIGMLALAVLRVRAIPFFAVIAAVVIAENFGAFVQRREARSTLPKSNAMVNLARYGSRVFAFFAGVMLLIASWAGWLQPIDEQRRLAWNVEVDESLKRTAEEFQHRRTRSENPLPPEVHGFFMQTDLAHYCAWFAPDEKTFFDGRLAFHAPEADTFLEIRRYLGVRKKSEEKLSEDFIPELFQKHSIAYLAHGSPLRTENTQFFQRRWRARSRLGSRYDSAWVNWSIHGRVVVLGWTAQTALDAPRFDAMRFHAKHHAFGPEVQPIPAPSEASLPLMRNTLTERFLFAPPAESPAAEESILLGQWLQIQQTIYQQVQICLSAAQASLNPRWYLVPPDTLAPEWSAAAVLALRSARQAIVQSPQNGEGYLALALAYSNPLTPTPLRELPGFNDDISIISLERFLARTTPEEQQARGDFTVFDQAMLVCQYQRDRSIREHPPRDVFERQKISDLMLETARRARVYLRSMAVPQISLELLNHIRGFLGGSGATEVSPTTVAETLKRMDDRILEWEKQLNEQTELFRGQSQQVKSVVGRASLARHGHALSFKALEELRKFDKDESKAGNDEQFVAVLEITEVLLSLGQVEEAVAQIDASDEDMKTFRDRVFQVRQGRLTIQEQQQLQQGQQQWWGIKMRAFCAQGNLRRVSEMLQNEAMNFRDQPFPWPKELGKAPPNNDWLYLTPAYLLLDRLLNASTADVAKHMLAMPPPLYLEKLPQLNFHVMGEVAARRVSLMSQFQLRLGFAYLEQGNNAAAKQQFEQAARPFGLDIPHAYRRTAEYYARLLQ